MADPSGIPAFAVGVTCFLAALISVVTVTMFGYWPAHFDGLGAGLFVILGGLLIFHSRRSGTNTPI